MPADASAFSCLPLAVRDSLLEQAFQQLDQRHLFGVAPRVCRLWHQLSLSIITSLDAKISTEEAAEQLNFWIQRHGPGFISLDLLLQEPVCLAPAAWSLLQSVQAAKELRSLSLSATTQSILVNDFSLHTLTNLTSLSISNCDPTSAARDSILGLTKLSSLSLCRSGEYPKWISSYSRGFLKQLSTSLVGLTKLDFSGVGAHNTHLVHLHNLPQLKELLTGAYMSVDTLVQVGELPFTSVGTYLKHDTVGRFCLWLQTASGHLQKLALLGGEGLPTSAGLQLPMLELVHLKELSAYSVRLNMVHVAALTQLTHLEATRCELDDAAVCSLSPLSNLRILNIPSNSQITGAHGSMEVLARSMPQLTFLWAGDSDCEGSVVVAAEAAFGQRLVGSKRTMIGRQLSLQPLPGAER